jgi:hypothetical protein
MTAVTLAPTPHPLGVVWEICGYNMFCSDAVVVLYSIVFFVPVATKPLFGLLFGNHIVDASSLVSFYHYLV